MALLLGAFGPDSMAIETKVADRNEAIRTVGELLVRSNRVRQHYVFEMLSAVEEFGPYIVIAPGIALAHAKPSQNVIATGLSMLVLREPIEFNHPENDPVRLVLGLAAVDHENHIELMAELAEFLGNEHNLEKLLAVTETSQIRELLQ